MHRCIPGVSLKSCTCHCFRQFYTREEQLEQLKKYKAQIEKELEGVETEIERLQQ